MHGWCHARGEQPRWSLIWGLPLIIHPIKCVVIAQLLMIVILYFTLFSTFHLFILFLVTKKLHRDYFIFSSFILVTGRNISSFHLFILVTRLIFFIFSSFHLGYSDFSFSSFHPVHILKHNPDSEYARETCQKKKRIISNRNYIFPEDKTFQMEIISKTMELQVPSL